MLGLALGLPLGETLGLPLGAAVGLVEGEALGELLGLVDGLWEGLRVGLVLGLAVGLVEGEALGEPLGLTLGLPVGAKVEHFPREAPLGVHDEPAPLQTRELLQSESSQQRPSKPHAGQPPPQSTSVSPAVWLCILSKQSAPVGDDDGDTVGETLGARVGDIVGDKLGELLGDAVGLVLGLKLGLPEDGEELGTADGDTDGDADGDAEGDADGDADGAPTTTSTQNSPARTMPPGQLYPVGQCHSEYSGCLVVHQASPPEHQPELEQHILHVLYVIDVECAAPHRPPNCTSQRGFSIKHDPSTFALRIWPLK